MTRLLIKVNEIQLWKQYLEECVKIGWYNTAKITAKKHNLTLAPEQIQTVLNNLCTNGPFKAVEIAKNENVRLTSIQTDTVIKTVCAHGQLFEVEKLIAEGYALTKEHWGLYLNACNYKTDPAPSVLKLAGRTNLALEHRRELFMQYSFQKGYVGPIPSNIDMFRKELFDPSEFEALDNYVIQKLLEDDDGNNLLLVWFIWFEKSDRVIRQELLLKIYKYVQRFKYTTFASSSADRFLDPISRASKLYKKNVVEA